jgi:hypothetical protein|tara:strand:- start:3650 stop:4819 length:1170 start_codon:yes stop_codon:yes gene_type:complete
MAQEAIWPGSSSFSTGSTPYGFYDSDTEFSGSGAHSVDRFAEWAAKRLGYPIIEVELSTGSFYACYEEAVTEYSAQVNQFNIRDNLLSLKGQATSSNLTHKRLSHTMGEQIFLSETYGSEAGVGGQVERKKSKITIHSGSQDYDLNTLIADPSASGPIEVTKVFYEATPAINRYFDPYAGTGQQTNNMLNAFGFGGSSPAITFVLQPIYADLLRVQAIEFNDQIRKSAYSFELVDNNLRIFPRITTNQSASLWVEWKEVTDRDNVLRTRYSGSADTVSDISNARYDNMEYRKINDVGKQWIRKYGLALCKELLGMVRSKYGTIPIPNSEVSLDGDTLRAEATAEKEQLMEQLREMLDQTSNKALLEADREASENLQEKLKKVPYPLYIG